MVDNPYLYHPEDMRRALEDPSVNQREHEIYAPRLFSLLPRDRWRDSGIERVLDFGCGAGNFTARLAERYKSAEVIGTDAAPDIFDAVHYGDIVRFVQWDGQAPVDIGQFDLITSKMTLHYLDLAQLDNAVRNLTHLLTDSGELAVSAPYSGHDLAVSKAFVAPITAQVGHTGMKADMWDYAIIPAVLAAYTPEDYGYIADYVSDERNNIKRVNTLIYPKEKFNLVRKRLMRAGISNGDYDWYMMEQFTDALRRVGNYLVERYLKEL